MRGSDKNHIILNGGLVVPIKAHEKFGVDVFYIYKLTFEGV